ncbi:dTDP-4-dehydrorhamnose reductase [bacterium]|nr:MAG: dTDP-4-dehydrorhamnose reductase [bacterium]
MKNKIIIFGANGQLGTALSNLFEKENIDCKGFDFPSIDITIPETYQKKIIDYNPDILINCAAYTNVYQAETDVENAIAVNGIALEQLVEICTRMNVYFIHISTDYVFNGKEKKLYSEIDLPNPINIYGLSKYIGEKIIQLHSNNYVIIRTAALYGNSKNDSINVVKKIIKVAKENNIVKLVNDEYISPTNTENLAEQILLIIENKTHGVVHATSEGYCNWVEFGSYLFELLKMNVEIEEVNSAYFNKNIHKPKFSVLENKFLRDQGIYVMNNWKDSLALYVKTGLYNEEC